MTKKPKAQATKSLSQSKIQRLENGNIEIIINVPWEEVSEEYKKSLTKLSKSAKIKGFRPGKAPLKLVEEKIGKGKIYQEMAKSLLTQVYLEAVKAHKLLPVVNPQLNLVSSDEGKDWQVRVITAELPKVELSNYQEEIKKSLEQEKIWVPGKDKEKKEESREKKLQKIFTALLETVQIKIPQILIEDEVNRMLSRLIDQTARLGLTVEQYLASVGKTSQKIREEYEKQAQESIKLELILSAIANQEKIKIEDQEVEKMIKVTGDEKLKQSLQTPTQKAYLRQILRKRKALDILLKL